MIDDPTIAWCAYCRKQTLIEAGEPLPLCSVCGRDQEQLSPRDLDARLLAEKAEAISSAIARALPTPAQPSPKRSRDVSDRKMHPKSYAARVLGIHESRLQDYIDAGLIHATRWGTSKKGDPIERIADDEVKKYLRDGLPQLPGQPAPSPPRARKMWPAPRPEDDARDGTPGSRIRALKV